jgi:glutathione S-transferase
MPGRAVFVLLLTDHGCVATFLSRNIHSSCRPWQWKGVLAKILREETPVPLVDLIIALSVLEFLVFCMAVGRARATYQVAAPATTGNEVFERYFRVQMNTLEQLVIFLPAIWIFARYLSAPVAAAFGAVFILGRWIYFRSYVKNPKSRSAGFALSALPNVALLLGAIIGAARAILK